MREPEPVTIAEVTAHLSTRLAHADERLWNWPYAGRAAWFPLCLEPSPLVDVLPERIDLAKDSDAVNAVRDDVDEEIVAIASLLHTRLEPRQQNSDEEDDEDWEIDELSDLSPEDLHRALDVWERVARPIRYANGSIVRAFVTRTYGEGPHLLSVPVDEYVLTTTMEATALRDGLRSAETRMRRVLGAAALGWFLFVIRILS